MKRLMSQSEFARARGLNKSTIAREVQRGAIPLSRDGKIDPEVADAARRNNLDPRKTKKHPSESDEFLSGAMWLAEQISNSARRALPGYFKGLRFGDTATRVVVVGSVLVLIEGWLDAYLKGAELEPINWSAFGRDAESIREQMAALAGKWKAASR